MVQAFSALTRAGHLSFLTTILLLASTVFLTGCAGDDTRPTSSLGANLGGHGKGPKGNPAPATCFVYTAGATRSGESRFSRAELELGANELLAPSKALQDVVTLAAHPSTRMIYALAELKHHGRGGKKLGLYTVDAVTGAGKALGATGFRTLKGLNFRETDETLWTWAPRHGLVQLDLRTGRGSLVFHSRKTFDALAWNTDGSALYLAKGTQLWLHDPSAGTLVDLGVRLPKGVVSIQIRPDGYLFGAIGKPVVSESSETPPQGAADAGAADHDDHHSTHMQSEHDSDSIHPFEHDEVEDNGHHFGRSGAERRHDRFRHHRPEKPHFHEKAVQFFAYDPARGEVVATYEVPMPTTEAFHHGPKTVPFKRINGATWLNTCGNASAGGSAEIIQDIIVEPAQACLGEAVFVQVVTTHPENPGQSVEVSIDGVPGAERYVQFPPVRPEFFVPGPRTITVRASTAEGHHDLQHAEVNVTDCGTSNSSLVVAATPNPFHDATVDFTILTNAPPTVFGVPRYIWNFGDGNVEETTVPHVSHSYADSQSRDEPFDVFQAEILVQRPLLPDLSLSKTITVANTYALFRARGHIRPPVRARSTLSDAAGTLAGSFKLENREEEPISFSTRRLQYRYCDPDLQPSLLNEESYSLSIDAVSQADASVALTDVPADVCGVALHLLGSSQGLPMRSSVYMDIPDRAPRRLIENEQLVETLNRLRADGLLPNPERVTDEDLHRLVRERKTSAREIASPATAQSTSAFQALQTIAGDECQPGDQPEPGSNLVCIPSGQWSETQSGIVNAQKGDLLLVAACSFVGNMLRHLTPRQRYTHEAIMTRNFVELTHSTGSEEYLLDDRHQVGLFGSNGIKRTVLKYIWPGVLHQTIGEAFLGVTMGRDGEDYLIDDFSPNPVHCPGDALITTPLVVMPPLDAPPDVRAQLYEAADTAASLEAHYRFYAFTEGKIAFDPVFNAPAPDLRPATVSSQFLWWSLKTAGVNLEGDQLEVKDQRGIGGVHEGGAMIDEFTMDGLYVYTEAEREDGTQALWDFVHGSVLGKAGTFGDAVLDAPINYANQIANCFTFDFCGDNDTETLCNRDDLAVTVPPFCCSNPPDFPADECASKESGMWRFPAMGRTVSPDNFLFWDQPASTAGAEPGEDGVYGDTEPMVYRDNVRVPLYHWAPGPGFGVVQGRVIEQGTIACVDDAACAPDEVCAERTCRLACTADIDCSSGGFCLDGYCTRAVEGATVLFELAAPDTTRVTAADGTFPAYQMVPDTDGEETEIRARLLPTDPQNPDGETTLLGTERFVVGDQQLASVDILLRPTDPTLRQVHVKGKARMIDCDCDSRNDRATRDFEFFCSVNPDQPSDTFEIVQQNICVDEIGVSIVGECLLLASADSRTVRVQGDVTFFEGVANSCGGTEREDHFAFAADLPPEELNPPGAAFSLEFDNGLHHSDICPYAVFVVDCDDDVFELGGTSGVNSIQPF